MKNRPTAVTNLQFRHTQTLESCVGWVNTRVLRVPENRGCGNPQSYACGAGAGWTWCRAGAGLKNSFSR